MIAASREEEVYAYLEMTAVAASREEAVYAYLEITAVAASREEEVYSKVGWQLEHSQPLCVALNL